MTQQAESRDLARKVDQMDSASLRWAIDAARLVHNPVFPGAVFSVVLIVIGAGILAFSAWGIVDQYYVALQFPYFISGGFGALGLMITGAVLGSVLGNRRDNSMADEEMAGVIEDLTEVVRLAVHAHSSAGRGR